MVCKLCNHTHARGCAKCKKCHPQGAAPPSAQNVQRSKNNPNRIGATSRVGSSSSAPVVRTSWTVIGPNAVPNVPRGTVTRNYADVVASAPSRYLTVDFSDRFPHLVGNKLRILSVLMRVNSFHSGGWVGIVEDYDVSSPKGPDPMTRKGFSKDQARGWQWLAPSGLEFDDFARTHRLVFEFRTDFAATAKVLCRDIYVVTTELPRMMIPSDLLFVDEDLLED
uniref:Coat protein n=1 Tax=Lilac leaf chlorosis virus TaxID=722755 RepID=A0A3Q8AL76_9BROM|nr:coat protein [Lilac leaf chlorosis virus]